METGNVKKSSTSSVQYLLYRISFEEGIATPRKIFFSKNNYPCWLGYKANINTRRKTTRKKQHEQQQQ